MVDVQIARRSVRDTVAAASDWDGDMEIKQVRPSHRDSYERLCHESGQSHFLLDLRKSRNEPARRRLLEPGLERFIGVIYRPDIELMSHQAQASLRAFSSRFIEPLIPTSVDQPPSGDGWLHEIKHDGFRTLLAIDRGAVTTFSRRGHDWSKRYPRIVDAAAKLRCRFAIVDGEAIVQDENGVSHIEHLYAACASSRKLS
jgi:ATP-dependent DNA ligase